MTSPAIQRNLEDLDKRFPDTAISLKGLKVRRIPHTDTDTEIDTENPGDSDTEAPTDPQATDTPDGNHP